MLAPHDEQVTAQTRALIAQRVEMERVAERFDAGLSRLDVGLSRDDRQRLGDQQNTRILNEGQRSTSYYKLRGTESRRASFCVCLCRSSAHRGRRERTPRLREDPA